MSAELVDVTVEIHHETKDAVLVSIDGERKSAVWLPLSALELSRRKRAPQLADVTLSESLATQKGLV